MVSMDRSQLSTPNADLDILIPQEQQDFQKVLTAEKSHLFLLFPIISPHLLVEPWN